MVSSMSCISSCGLSACSFNHSWPACKRKVGSPSRGGGLVQQFMLLLYTLVVSPTDALTHNSFFIPTFYRVFEYSNEQSSVLSYT